MRKGDLGFLEHAGGTGFSSRPSSVEASSGEKEDSLRRETRESLRALLEDWEARNDDWMSKSTYTDTAQYEAARNNKYRSAWLASVLGNTQLIFERYPNFPGKEEIEVTRREIHAHLEAKKERETQFNEAMAEKLKTTEICTKYQICDTKSLGFIGLILAKDETGATAAKVIADMSPRIKADFAMDTVEHPVLGPRETPGQELVSFMSSCYDLVDIPGLKRQYLSTSEEAVKKGDELLLQLLRGLDNVSTETHGREDVDLAA